MVWNGQFHICCIHVYGMIYQNEKKLIKVILNIVGRFLYMLYLVSQNFIIHSYIQHPDKLRLLFTPPTSEENVDIDPS